MTRRNRPQGQSALPATLPAPIGGWNDRDPLGAMAPTDAVYLTNWFPSTTSVMQRYGHSRFSTGYGGAEQVQTLMNYYGASTNTFFSATSLGSIYSITAGGAIGAAAVSGLTNGKLQYINVATAGGNFMMAVNGANKMRYFDGTTWSADGGTYTVTGVATEACSQINLFKNRVWLIENNSLNVWYLPTSAIQGAATAFPLQGIATLGGYVMAMGTWTMDAGYGVDDMAVFITNMGEVIVYKGTDPASTATWALVGVWRLGAPVGRRCFTKYGGDMVLICQEGLLTMSAALQSDRVDNKPSMTDKIQNAVSSAITEYGANFGWQVIQFPRENMLILNVPVEAGDNQQQYVMNSITKSWCNFTGWEANCWEIFDDDLYFGGLGFVGKAWDTLADNATNIETNGKQAFNYFGGMEEKRFTLIRPNILSDGSPTALCNMDVNFADVDPTASLSFSSSTYALWDSAIWDSSIWGADLSVIRQWQGVNALGSCGAVRLKTASKNIQVQWISTDIVMEKGSIL